MPNQNSFPATKPSAAAHTPGPWNVQDLGANKDGYPYWHEYCVRAPNNVHLATAGSVDRFYESSNEANARLIAAAPELLAELARQADYLASLRAQFVGYQHDAFREELYTMEHNARAAIAKATGGTP